MKNRKIYSVLIYVLIFMAVLSAIVIIPLNELDELWNYNFASNIAHGLIPYKDFNMVVTPLLAIICGIILKITCYELIIMRILAAILCSTIFYITYKLFNLLNVKKEISLIFTLCIGYLFKDILCIDYNYASLLLVLIIIYNEIKFYTEDYKFIKTNFNKDIMLGILAGLSISIKQTSGILIAIVLLGNKLLFIRNKDELKTFARNFAYRLVGIIIPIIILIIYLLINNALEDFVSYTILGITEFSNKLPYKALFNVDLIGVLSIMVPLTFVYVWLRTIISEKIEKEYFLAIYGLAIFIICFPISDKIHFLIASLPIIILMLYEIYKIIILINNKITINYKKNILRVLNFLSIFLLIVCISINSYKYFELNNKYCELNHFSFIPIDKELELIMKNVSQYVKENEDVKILDWLAAISTIPADKYNKYYDMFNEGNFGYKGKEKIIEEISNSTNTKYLILKEIYNENWQSPKDIIAYVKNNKEKIGEIEIFDIYE